MKPGLFFPRKEKDSHLSKTLSHDVLQAVGTSHGWDVQKLFDLVVICEGYFQARN
jgi:hypothetical protein